VVVHLILGLPGESEGDMKDSVSYLARMLSPGDGVKLQLLHVLKGTKLAEEYEEEPFHILTLEEYTRLVVDALRILPENLVIHRITGDGPKSLLIEPKWSGDKKRVLNTLNQAIKNAVREESPTA
jgi:radical SAM superfamily enzyme